MVTFFKKHANVALGLFAIIFLIVIVGYVAWAVGVFTAEAGVAFSVPEKSLPPVSFNLKDAAALDLQGLVQH